MEYLLGRFINSRKIMTFSGNLKREDREVQMTHTYMATKKSLGHYRTSKISTNFFKTKVCFEKE